MRTNLREGYTYRDSLKSDVDKIRPAIIGGKGKDMS